MHLMDYKKMAYITGNNNYQDKVISFELKNIGTTHQMMMMTNVLHNQIRDMFKVCMDDMIIKLEEELNHTTCLKEVFFL